MASVLSSISPGEMTRESQSAISQEKDLAGRLDSHLFSSGSFCKMYEHTRGKDTNKNIKTVILKVNTDSIAVEHVQAY